MLNINRFFQFFFGKNKSLIDPNDTRALEIQRELDAEHGRQERSESQIYWPPGTKAPRKLDRNFN